MNLTQTLPLALAITVSLSAPLLAQTQIAMDHWSKDGDVGSFVTNGAQSDDFAYSSSLPFVATTIQVPGARAGYDLKPARIVRESLIFREFGSVDATANAGSVAGTISKFGARQQNPHKIILEIRNDIPTPRRERLADLVITIEGTQTGSGFVNVGVDVDDNGTIDMAYTGNQPRSTQTFFGFGINSRGVTLIMDAGATRTTTGGGSYDFTVRAELVKPPISPMHVDIYYIDKQCSVGQIYGYDRPSRTAHNLQFNVVGSSTYPASFLTIGQRLFRPPLNVLPCPIYVNPDIIFPIQLGPTGRTQFNATLPMALDYTTYAELIYLDWRGGGEVSDVHEISFKDL